MSRIDLFDTDLGIQHYISSEDQARLPSAKPLATATIREASLDSIYSPVNVRNMVEYAVCPDAGDGEAVRADVFSRSLDSCATLLKNSRDSDVQDFLKRDLFPLLENDELLRTYYNLMLGG